MADPTLEGRVWIKCETHDDLLALREHVIDQLGGEMTAPEPHRRFYTAAWLSPDEGRGTPLEWEQAFRHAQEQAAMLLDGFEGAYLFAIHVQPVDTEQSDYPDTVPATVEREEPRHA